MPGSKLSVFKFLVRSVLTIFLHSDYHNYPHLQIKTGLMKSSNLSKVILPKCGRPSLKHYAGWTMYMIDIYHHSRWLRYTGGGKLFWNREVYWDNGKSAPVQQKWS